MSNRLRWIFLAAVLCCGSAFADTYTLPGGIGTGPFASCVHSSGSTYNCTGAIFLNDDTVNVASTMTLNLEKGLTAGFGSKILENSGAELTIVVTDRSVTLNTRSTTNADIRVTGTGSITLESEASLTGNLSTASGNVLIRSGATLNGSATAGSTGTITTDYKSAVKGALTTLNGNINIGSESLTTGNVTSTSGKISFGSAARLTGNVDTNGNVEAADSVRITGDVKASAGSVTLGFRAQVTGNVVAGDQLGFATESTVIGSCTSKNGTIHNQCSVTCSNHVGGTSTAASSKVNSVTLTPPAGVALGNLMVAYIAQRGGASPLVSTAPADWTSLLTNTGSSQSVAVYYKIAGTSEVDATWTLSANDYAAGGIVAFRGVNLPIIASASRLNPTPTSTDPNTPPPAYTAYAAPEVTTLVAKAMLVSFFSAPNGNGSVNTAAGMAQAFTSAATSAGPDGLVIGASYTTQSIARLSGTNLSAVNAPLASLGVTVAIRPDCTAPAVDHYELSLPSSSISCLPSTVTVTACSNATSPCTSAATTVSGKTATLTTTGATLGATTLTFNASGTASTTLSYPGAANATIAKVDLSGETTAATKPRQCCTNGTSCTAADSCSTTFNSAGFIVSTTANGTAATIPTQTAGTGSGTYYLRAVQSGTTTAACTAALTGANTVNWAYQCNNPTTCAASNLLSLNGGTDTTIAGNANAAVSSYTAVPMTFETDGSARFNFTYNDAGQITLYAQKTLTASSTVAAATLAGSSNAFVSKPAGFTVTNIQQTASPQLANPAASDAAGSKFVKAGESFSATVTATTSTGAATPNFGKESTSEGVLLTPNLVLPSPNNGGVVGTVSINNVDVAKAPISGSSFTSGVASVTNLAWSEVGILQLTPRVADGNYLGAGDVIGDRSGNSSANIGRFYPDHFSVVSGSFGTDSTTRGYTYMGQPFGINLVLEARNTSDVKTANYSTTGGFAKLDPTVAAGWPSTALGTTPATGSWGLGASGTPGLTGAAALDVSTRVALSGTPSGIWVAGSVTVAANLSFSRPTATTAPSAASATAGTTWGPFENTLSVGLYPKDADSVTLAGSALNLDGDLNGTNERISLGTTTIRLGRLLLFNSYGSELLNPRVEIRAQAYGASGGWVTHTADSHTALAGGNVATSNTLGALTAPLAVASVSSPLVSGVGTIIFTKPSPARTGSFDIALNLSASGVDTSCNTSHGGTAANLVWLKDFGYTNCSDGATTWLRDPNARITLGSPKQPYLYLRERY